MTRRMPAYRPMRHGRSDRNDRRRPFSNADLLDMLGPITVLNDMQILVLPERIELSTSPLPRGCSTTELRQHRARAGGATGYTRPRRLARRADRSARLRPISSTAPVEPGFACLCLARMVWHGSTIDP